MRSKCTAVGLVLAAAFALAAAGAGSASALPNLKPTPTLSAPVKFKGTGGTVELQDGPTEGPYQCKESSIAGEFISGTAMRNTVVTWSHCEGEGYSFNSRAYKGPGDGITSLPLVGHLAYINTAKKEVGLMFGAEFKHKFEEVEPGWAEEVESCIPLGCSGLTNWTGQLITSITPVNKLSKTLTVVATEKEGNQGLTKFEGGSEHQELLGAGFEFSNTLSFEQGGKAVEVKVEA